MEKIEQTIIIKIVAENKQAIKDLFKNFADRLFYDCERDCKISGYKIMYDEKKKIDV